MTERFELTEYQLLTPGLYSGDDIKITINYRVECNSFWRYLPWGVKIVGKLDGQTASVAKSDIGVYGGMDNMPLVFTGKMPRVKTIQGELAFIGILNAISGIAPFEFARKKIVIPNLDDVTPPDGDGVPVVCTKGQEKCVGPDRWVCLNNQWVIKEYNSPECGFTPPPICTEGEETCSGHNLLACVGGQWVVKETNSAICGYVPPDGDGPTPPPDDGIPGWFERNKTTIIVVSAVVLAITLTLLAIKKLKFRAPIVKR